MSMSLCEWYANREVLLTGVTSELGRILLEKILRCFPNVKVHVVLRSLNGFNKDDRVKKIFASPGYERLRQRDPNALSRVTAHEGNLLYENLGMSEKDKLTLTKVSVLFHASGPHGAVFEFCQELPGLKAVAAATSIFKNKGQIVEEVQNERIPEIPLALVRIPFVGPAYREPMPGFVEILRGPTALIAGAGYVLGKAELPAEIIPLDIAVNTLIAAAWEKATTGKKGPTVYNAPNINCTWGDLIKKSHRIGRNFAYPTFGIRGMTSIVALHWILVLLLEWLPSVLCDTILSFCGKKPRILAEYERVRNALRSLESISSRPWSAERNRVYLLQERLTPEDQDAFPVFTEIDVETYVLCAAAATRKYCVDESNLGIVTLFRWMLLAFVSSIVSYAVYFAWQICVT